MTLQTKVIATFCQKQLFTPKKICENINSADPNTSSNSLRSCLVYHGKKKY